MKIKILFDRILVEQCKADDKTAGGIYIPDQAKNKPLKGQIVLVGSGKMSDGTDYHMNTKVGDYVLYDQHTGTPIELEGKEYLIMRDPDILGICE